MFIKKEDTALNSQMFVERMREKPVDVVIAKNTRNFSPELALDNFVSFVASISYKMIEKRSKQLK